ncbi:MAG: ROK family transcriptional regulator, partial [Odoribacter splanchnicus]|nr:ROK family transcriptional regulator [Odoribacter splanchnicus]
LIYMAKFGEVTIADLARELNVSVPSVTKLVTELKEDGYLEDNGKIETSGGRRPNVFGLAADAFYFLGVDVRRRRLDIALLDFQGNIIEKKEGIPFVLENTMAAFEQICLEINNFIDESSLGKEKIIGVGISLTGRVDSNDGYSYTYFNFNETPLTDLFEERLGIRSYIENDSRAMVYAEKIFGVVKEEKNVLFLNLGRGIGVGEMFDGKLYYGKTGFAGELGHIPLLDNEIICHCGKKGSLETEASGIALEKMFIEHLAAGETSVLSEKWKSGEDILLYDIIEAANNDDVLSITLIANIAEKLGRGVGVLINLLNPDLVVVGGSLSLVGDYLMLPLKMAINKYSLSLVSKDTKFKMSKLGETASVIGVAMLVRAKILGVI